MKRALASQVERALFAPAALLVVAISLLAPRLAPAAGRTCGGCAVPPEAEAIDTSLPDHVVGDGTAESCDSDAVTSAVALGGIITFNCGADPVIIALSATAKIFNDTGPEIVIDGGGLVTLDGGDQVRILYMNTCDPDQVITTDHCQNQDHPRLTLQNLTFAHGNASGETLPGGGAVFARGGRLKIVNSRFVNNACDSTGPDVAGAAVYTLSQSDNLPVYVVGSTFGGDAALGNSCSNGGALGSIGVSYSIFNSIFSFNQATGEGANPPAPGTPGGGSGGAIYNDGDTFHLSLCGSRFHDDLANEGGGAIFFVSNNLTGTLAIESTYIWDCPSAGFSTPPYDWLFYLGSGPPQIVDSVFDVRSPDVFCDGFEFGVQTDWGAF